MTLIYSSSSKKKRWRMTDILLTLIWILISLHLGNYCLNLSRHTDSGLNLSHIRLSSLTRPSFPLCSPFFINCLESWERHSLSINAPGLMWVAALMGRSGVGKRRGGPGLYHREERCWPSTSLQHQDQGDTFMVQVNRPRRRRQPCAWGTAYT